MGKPVLVAEKCADSLRKRHLAPPYPVFRTRCLPGWEVYLFLRGFRNRAAVSLAFPSKISYTMARRRKQKQSDDTLVDIVEVRDQAQSFLDGNQNLLFGILVGVVALIGGYLAYQNFYIKPRQANAVEQMYRAQQQFERDSFSLALNNPGGGYMGFLELIDEYGSTDAGNLARYYAGISWLQLGKYEAALDYLKQYDASGSITPIMKYGAMGDAYSELQDFDNAMKFYEKAVNQDENNALTPYYLLKVGMLHERNNNPSAAREAYEEIKEEYPNSSMGASIEKYLARVAAQ